MVSLMQISSTCELPWSIKVDVCHNFTWQVAHGLTLSICSLDISNNKRLKRDNKPRITARQVLWWDRLILDSSITGNRPLSMMEVKRIIWHSHLVYWDSTKMSCSRSKDDKWGQHLSWSLVDNNKLQSLIGSIAASRFSSNKDIIDLDCSHISRKTQNSATRTL